MAKDDEFSRRKLIQTLSATFATAAAGVLGTAETSRIADKSGPLNYGPLTPEQVTELLESGQCSIPSYSP